MQIDFFKKNNILVTKENTNESGNIYVACPECAKRKDKQTETAWLEKHVLQVNLNDNYFKCLRCGWYGSEKSGIIHKEAKAVHRDTPGTFPACESVLKYFESREIDRDTVNNFGIRSWSYKNDPETIIFPHAISSDLVVNHKYRKIDKSRMWQDKAEKLGEPYQIFVGIQFLQHQNYVYIVEGEIDLLSLHAVGEFNVLSVPSGGIPEDAKNLSNKMKFLDNSYNYIKDIKEFRFMLDDDPVGKRMEKELARRLGRGKCKIVNMPDGLKDANKILVDLGAETLINTLENLKEYPIAGIITIESVENEIFDILENGYPNYPRTTIWSKEDKKLRYQRKNLIVRTGISGRGKTTFIDALNLNYALSSYYDNEKPYKIAYWGAEGGDVKDAMIKHLCYIAGKHDGIYYDKNINNFEKLTKGNSARAREFLHEYMFYLETTSKEANTMEKVLELTGQLVSSKGIQALIIDNFSNLSIENAQSYEKDYHQKILGFMNQKKKELDINITLIAHPRKIAAKEKNSSAPDWFTDYEQCTLMDINGSVMFKNLACHGGITGMKYDENTQQVLTTNTYEKVKSKYNGRAGYSEYRFSSFTGRFLPHYESLDNEIYTPYFKQDYLAENFNFQDYAKSFENEILKVDANRFF